MNISRIVAANVNSQSYANNKGRKQANILAFSGGGNISSVENPFSKLFGLFKKQDGFINFPEKPIEFLEDVAGKDFTEIVKNIQMKLMKAGVELKYNIQTKII